MRCGALEVRLRSSYRRELGIHSDIPHDAIGFFFEINFRLEVVLADIVTGCRITRGYPTLEQLITDQQVEYIVFRELLSPNVIGNCIFSWTSDPSAEALGRIIDGGNSEPLSLDGVTGEGFSVIYPIVRADYHGAVIDCSSIEDAIWREIRRTKSLSSIIGGSSAPTCTTCEHARDHPKSPADSILCRGSSYAIPLKNASLIIDLDDVSEVSLSPASVAELESIYVVLKTLGRRSHTYLKAQALVFDEIHRRLNS